VSCIFENRGADDITSFSFRKGFVGYDFYTYTSNRLIESEKILQLNFKSNFVPPYAQWSSSPYRIEIISVNGIDDDDLTDNAYEFYINPGDITPQP